MIKEVIESANKDFGFIMYFLKVLSIYLQGDYQEGNKQLLELLRSFESNSLGWTRWHFDDIIKIIKDSNIRKETKEPLLLLTNFANTKTQDDRLEIVRKVREAINRFIK